MAKNTLESLNRDSLLTAHRSGSDLVDKTAKQDTQGVTVSNLSGFEKFEPTGTAAPAAGGAQNFPNAKRGDCFTVISGNAGKIIKYICGADYGSSLCHDELITNAITTNAGATGLTEKTSDTAINGGSSVITHSGSGGAGLELAYRSSTSAISKLLVTAPATDFAVGDTITITGLAGQASDEPIVVTLRKLDLDVGVWAEEHFSTLEAGATGFTPS